VKEGAALDKPESGDIQVLSEEEAKEAQNPFAALKNLKKIKFGLAQMEGE